MANDPERERSRVELRIEPLGDRARGAGFSCGNLELGAFLATDEGDRFDKQWLGKCCLVFRGDALAAYFTGSAAELRVEYLHPPEPWADVMATRVEAIPALKIGRLAVDSRFQGVGVGKAAVRRVVAMALAAKASVGVRRVTLQAKPESVPFHLALGFHMTPGTRRERRRKNRTLFLDLQRADEGAPA